MFSEFERGEREVRRWMMSSRFKKGCGERDYGERDGVLIRRIWGGFGLGLTLFLPPLDSFFWLFNIYAAFSTVGSLFQL